MSINVLSVSAYLLYLMYAVEAFSPDFLDGDFSSILKRWNIKHLTVIEEDSDLITNKSLTVRKATAHVSFMWINSVKIVDIQQYLSPIGAMLLSFKFQNPQYNISELIAWSSSSRPLFLCSLRDTSLPAWLRKTRIPFTSNVYVILQDAHQPGSLTLQGVYHLHEESNQLTVDLVGRRALQGPNTRWTFFGPKYNTIRRADLHGLPIRTVIPIPQFDTTDPRFAAFKSEIDPFLQLLLQTFNASLVPVTLKERSSIGTRNESGHWNGMIGMLNRREAEFSSVSLAPSAAIGEVIDFTCPYAYKVYQMYIRKPVFRYSLSTSFRGFTVPLWITLVTTLGFLSVSTTAISFFEFSLCSKKTPQFGLSESMLCVLGSCCLQGWGRVANSKSGSLACLSCILFGYLLNLFYVSQLQATITAKTMPLPFSDLEGLVNTKGYLPGIFPGTTPYVLAQFATNGPMRRIREMISKERARVILPTLIAGLERICIDKIAMMIWKSPAVTKFLQQANCTVVDTKASIFPIFVSLGVVKGYPYKRLIDFFLRRIVERGIIAHFTTVKSTDIDHVIVFTPIEMEDVIPFLVLYAGALAFALAVLFVEILFSSVKNCYFIGTVTKHR